MTETTTRRKFVWGGLRLFLGITQMTLALVGLGLMLMVGFRPVTWIFFAAAKIVTITSLLIYKRRPDHPLGKGNTYAI
jgi:hypothetical protein